MKQRETAFFVKTAPLGFFSCFGPCFCVHLLCHSCSLLRLLHCCLRFGVFFELVFHSDCIRPNKEFSLNADWSEIFWPGEKQITSSQSTCLYTDLAFLIIRDRFRTVRSLFGRWSGCEMTCSCYITGTTIIYSVHEHVLL